MVLCTSYPAAFREHPDAVRQLSWVDMNVTEMCAARREELLGMWVERFISSYPLQRAGFMRTSTAPFANPVGQPTRASLGVLFDAVIGLDASPRQVKAALDDLIRLRAVQDFTPSQAVGPLFLLKDILRTALLDPDSAEPKGRMGQSGREELPRARPSAGEILDGCFEAEARLDSLALLALDLYAADRERIFRMRVDEVKRAQSSLLRWAQRQGLSPEGSGNSCSGEGNA